MHARPGKQNKHQRSSDYILRTAQDVSTPLRLYTASYSYVWNATFRTFNAEKTQIHQILTEIKCNCDGGAQTEMTSPFPVLASLTPNQWDKHFDGNDRVHVGSRPS